MPEQKKKTDKKLSLAPLNFEDALKGLLATEPPPKEKSTQPPFVNNLASDAKNGQKATGGSTLFLARRPLKPI